MTTVGAVRIDDADLVLRLLAAVALCSLIGFERSTRDEVAGLRTHALVGLGAAPTLVPSVRADFVHVDVLATRCTGVRTSAVPA